MWFLFLVLFQRLLADVDFLLYDCHALLYDLLTLSNGCALYIYTIWQTNFIIIWQCLMIVLPVSYYVHIFHALQSSLCFYSVSASSSVSMVSGSISSSTVLFLLRFPGCLLFWLPASFLAAAVALARLSTDAARGPPAKFLHWNVFICRLNCVHREGGGGSLHP